MDGGTAVKPGPDCRGRWTAKLAGLVAVNDERCAAQTCVANGRDRHVVVYTGYVTTASCGDGSTPDVFRQPSFACPCLIPVYECSTEVAMDTSYETQSAGQRPPLAGPARSMTDTRDGGDR